jgi:hypothetical protein
MGRHPSKVSRIENGAATPSVADIKLWCQHTQAGDREGELIDQLRRLEGMFVEWRRLERSGLRQFQETFVPLNYQTRKFRAYSSWLIPGPLQTEAYTRVLLNLIARRRGFPNDIEEVMPIRARRDRALYEGDRTYAILLEEWVLRLRRRWQRRDGRAARQADRGGDPTERQPRHRADAARQGGMVRRGLLDLRRVPRHRRAGLGSPHVDPAARRGAVCASVRSARRAGRSTGRAPGSS